MQTISHLTFRMLRMTPRSIADAKAYQQVERDKVYQATGLRITDEGAAKAMVVIACLHGDCLYTACGATQEKAFRKLEAHLSRKHGMRAPAEVA